MKRKFLITTLIYLIGQHIAFACDVCKKNQPAGFENITHGAGPSGTMDFIIIGVATVIVLFTLVLCFKYLIKPQENDPDHIKNIVRNEGF
jgi:high-affinity nickel permease